VEKKLEKRSKIKFSKVLIKEWEREIIKTGLYLLKVIFTTYGEFKAAL